MPFVEVRDSFMGNKRVTLIGGNGYVGGSMSAYLKRKDITLSTPRSCEYDANRPSELRRLVEDTKPDIIINCAEHTGKPNVDACESQKAECIQGNVLMPHQIREIAREKGIVFGQVSSGCIFTGRRDDGGGFREIDPPNFSFRHNNCSFYSGTKAMGEEVLGYQATPQADGSLHWENSSPDCFVWRLRIPFAGQDSPRNYLSKVMNYPTLLEAENSLSRLEDFASACWQTIESGAPLGLYNVTNPGAITTSEVTEIIKKVGHDTEKKTGINPFPQEFDFFDDEAQFLSSVAVAARSNCVLDTSKLQSLGIQLPGIRDAITDCLKDWIPQSLASAVK